MRVPNQPFTTVVSVAAASADLIIVTLAVAWALEDVIYFSLLVGLPLGILSAAVTFVLLRRVLGQEPEQPLS